MRVATNDNASADDASDDDDNASAHNDNASADDAIDDDDNANAHNASADDDDNAETDNASAHNASADDDNAETDNRRMSRGIHSGVCVGCSLEWICWCVQPVCIHHRELRVLWS